MRASAHEHTARTPHGRLPRHYGRLAQVRPRVRTVTYPASEDRAIAANAVQVNDPIYINVDHRFHRAGDDPATFVSVSAGGWTFTANTLTADYAYRVLHILTPRGWVLEVTLDAWERLLQKAADSAIALGIPAPTADSLGCANKYELRGVS